MTTHDLPIKDLKLLTDVVTEEELKEYQAKLSADINLVTDSKIKEALRHLIDDAPEAFDTLKEIAEWLINHGKKAKDLVDRVFELSNTVSALSVDLETNYDTIESVDDKVSQLESRLVGEASDLSSDISLHGVKNYAEARVTSVYQMLTKRVNALKGDDTDLSTVKTINGIYNRLTTIYNFLNDKIEIEEEKIRKIIADAPEALDTLKEIADWIENHAQEFEDIKNHVNNTDVHVTAENKETWNGKQDALDRTQMAAVNSGVTADWKTDVDADLSDYDTRLTTLETESATKTEVQTAEQNAKDYVNSLSANYDTKGSASQALVGAKEYTDSKIDTVNNDISALKTNKADLSSVYTKEQADAKFLTEHQDISQLALKSEVYSKEEADQKFLTEHQDISGKADLSSVYSKTEADAKFLTEHQDISGKADKTDVYTKTEADAKFLTEHQDISGKADLSSVYTKNEADATFLKEHQDISNLASKTEVQTAEQNAKNYADGLSVNYDAKGDATQALADAKTYVDEGVAKTVEAILSAAPQTFDTLKEIADWIEHDEQGTAALINRVADVETNKADVSALNNIWAEKIKFQVGLTNSNVQAVLEDLYNKNDSIESKLNNKAEISDILNVENDIQQVASSLGQSISQKADKADVYTKTEADAKFLQEHQDISGKADLSTVTNLQTYTENAFSQVAEEMNSKASNEALTATNERLSTAETTLTQVGSNVAQLGTTVSNHTSNTDIHTSADEKAVWNAKQNALSETQLSAVNSGVDSSWKSNVDGHLTGLDSAIQGITTSLNNKANKSDVDEIINNLSTVVNPKLEQILDLVEEEVEKVDQKADLSSVYSKTEADATFLKEHQDISGKADLSSITALEARVQSLENQLSGVLEILQNINGTNN